MEIIGSIFAFAFATACAILALWHEGRWRKRIRSWEAARGRVVGFAEGKPIKTLFGGEASSDDGPYPEIEFPWKGSPHRFISGYGGSGLPRIGSEVDVLYDSTTGNAEPGDETNPFMGQPLYHAALGIPRLLEIVSKCDCICRHLEYDQHPELHLYLIIQRAEHSGVNGGERLQFASLWSVFSPPCHTFDVRQRI